jgi:protein-disulfide isomerase
MIRENVKYVLLSLSLLASAMVVSTGLINAADIIVRSDPRAVAVSAPREFILSQDSIDAIASRVEEKIMAKLPPLPKPEPAPGERIVAAVTPGSNIMGNAQAPVSVIEFSDFECPFSKKFFTASFADIKKNFIDIGKASFSYRNLPLPFHQNARLAAMTAECAGDQGKYWNIFEKFMSSEKIDEASIQQAAKDSGLNMTALDTCVKNKTHDERINTDLKEAQNNGIEGTPTVLINGRVVSGAYPYATFEKIISEELAKAQKKD